MGAFRSMRSLQPGQGMVGRLWGRAGQQPPCALSLGQVQCQEGCSPTQLATQGLKQPSWAAPTRRSQAGCRAPEHDPVQTRGSAPVGWGCEASSGRNPWPCCPPPTVSGPNLHTGAGSYSLWPPSQKTSPAGSSRDWRPCDNCV